jgi:zinc and cadmium transporter
LTGVDPTLLWIVGSGLVMSAIALVGGVTLLLPERTLEKVLLPLVALSAGSLIGGALFHMLPASFARMGTGLDVPLYTATGFTLFFGLEQLLRWHHCHRAPSRHRRPVTYLVLIADGVHNYIGGLAVGGAFLVDLRLGMLTWLAAAAHEVPQELGDFGVLVHGGWSAQKALLYNLLSALTFPLGGVTAYAVASRADVSFLLPFAAGNFLYIGAVDLIPELHGDRSLAKSATHVLAFVAGMGIIVLFRVVLPE